MIQALRRQISIYGALAAVVPKLMAAYSLWFWVEFFGQLIQMTIFVFFWRAVYASATTVGGMTAAQTITYILLAQMIAPLVRWSLILDFGFMLHEGTIAIELLRPVDIQLRFYVQGLANACMTILKQSIPSAVLAWLVFGLSFPHDVRVWGAFLISFLLGHAILFCFDWMFACLAFYMTETWGLHMVREGIVTFFSGALLPLAMLPAWLGEVAAALPFGQALYVPLALLTGTIGIDQVPRVWLGQLLWLVGLAIASRLIFQVTVRKVTVQGG